MKKKLVISIVLLLAAALAIGGFSYYRYAQEQEAIRLAEEARLQEEQWQQREIENNYVAQNNAFCMMYKWDGKGNHPVVEYTPYVGVDEPILYIKLHVYKKETGNEVTLQDVAEYLSTSTEEDGRLRLYNNGKHPDIQGYVEWERNHQNIIRQYTSAIIGTLVDYNAANPGTPVDKGWVQITLEEMIELIKKTDDPSYEMQFPDSEE